MKLNAKQLLEKLNEGEKIFKDVIFTDNLSKLDFSFLTMENCVFQGLVNRCKFNGSNLKKSTFARGVSHCDFKKADLRGASFERQRLQYCNFTGVKLDRTTNFSKTTFNRCAFDFPIFEGTEYLGLSFGTEEQFYNELQRLADEDKKAELERLARIAEQKEREALQRKQEKAKQNAINALTELGIEQNIAEGMIK